jgi:hypothetical protein
MSALSPVFGQEESVPVLEEVNAPGLHRASPAKIHTSQVDLVRFRQNFNFHEAQLAFYMKFCNQTFSFAQATYKFPPFIIFDPDPLVRDTDPDPSLIKQK